MKTLLICLSLLICTGSYQDDEFNKGQAMLAVACHNGQTSPCIDYANNQQERGQAQAHAAAALNGSVDQMNNQLHNSFKAEKESTRNLYDSIQSSTEIRTHRAPSAKTLTW